MPRTSPGSGCSPRLRYRPLRVPPGMRRTAMLPSGLPALAWSRGTVLPSTVAQSILMKHDLQLAIAAAPVAAALAAVRVVGAELAAAAAGAQLKLLAGEQVNGAGGAVSVGVDVRYGQRPAVALLAVAPPLLGSGELADGLERSVLGDGHLLTHRRPRLPARRLPTRGR